VELALVVNPTKQSSLAVVAELRAGTRSGQHRLRLWAPHAAELRARPDYAGELDGLELTHDVRQSDVVVALGGDGTLLQAVHLLQGAERPLLGINLGGLGFLTDTPEGETEAALACLLEGRYRLDARMLLEATWQPEGRAPRTMTALNEVAMVHGSRSHLVAVAMRAGGVDLGGTLADGVIVATPSGSTAYSLSAGGPVVSPRLHALVVTPISAHTLSMRPLVVSADETVELELLPAPAAGAEVAVDGRAAGEVRAGERLLVRRAPRDLQLVKTQDGSFYDTLRTKLGWGHSERGDLRRGR